MNLAADPGEKSAIEGEAEATSGEAEGSEEAEAEGAEGYLPRIQLHHFSHLTAKVYCSEHKKKASTVVVQVCSWQMGLWWSLCIWKTDVWEIRCSWEHFPAQKSTSCSRIFWFRQIFVWKWKKIFVSQCFIGISEEISPIFVDVHVFSRPQRGVRTFSDMTSAFHAPWKSEVKASKITPWRDQVSLQIFCFRIAHFDAEMASMLNFLSFPRSIMNDAY